MDKLQQVYDLYLSQGLLSDNISFEQFSAADEEQQNKLYTLGKENGLFSTTGADTFKSAWGSQSFQTDPVKETASAGSKNQAVSMVSASEDGSLESEDAKLNQYRQRLYDTFTLPKDQIIEINKAVDNIDFNQKTLTIQSAGGGFAGMGAAAQSFVGVNPYKEELKQAEAELKKSGKDYSRAEVETQAREIIKRNKVREQIELNQEEILEEVKSEYLSVPGAILSTFGVGVAGMSPGAKYFGMGGEYERVRAELTKDVEEYGKEKTEQYESLLNSTQANAESALASMELLKQYEKKKANGQQLSQDEIDTYQAVALRVQAQNDIINRNMDKLSGLSEEVNNIDALADMTKRSYSNWHIARNRIGATVANIAGGIITVGDEITPLSIIERAYGLDFSKEENLDMLPEFLQPIVADVYKGKNFATDNAAKFFFDAAKDITAGVEKRQEISKISGVEDFFEFTLDLMSEQAVNTAITAGVPGAGLAIVSAGAAGQKMNEMNIEMADGQKISPLQYYGAALMSFGAEYLTEKVSLDNFNKLAKVNYKKAFNITNPDYTLDINKIKLGTALGNWVKSVNKEGTAELAAELINNVSDKFLLEKDISLTDGLGEAYLSGAVMSGLGFNAPVLAADLVGAFTRDDLQIKNNERVKEILNITKEINNLSLKLDTDPSAAESIKALQQRLDGLYQEQHDALNQTYKNVDDLSNTDKRSLLDIESYIYRAKRAIDKINSDPNLSQESKANLINTFKGRINTLNNKKNNIINSVQYSKEQQKARRFQEKLIAENGLEGKVQIVEGDTQKEALDKAKEAINNSELDAEVKKQLIEQIDKQAADPKFYAHGFTVGAEFGVPITVQMKDNATNGALGNSTVFSHELGHGVLFAKLIKQGADVVGMGQMLEKYARKNIKGANAIFDRVYKDYGNLLNKTNKDGTENLEYDPQAFAEELFLALKDVYSKRKDALDLTFRGKLFKAWNKLKGQDKRADNEIKNGQDVLDLMVSFVSAFETGEISGSFKALMEGRLKTVKANTAQKVKEGTIKMSKITPSQQEMNDRVDNLVGKKDESGNYTWDSKEAWQMSDEFANTYEQIIGGNLIDPLIRRGLEGEDVYGVPMQDFIQRIKSEEGSQSISELLLKFDPTKNNSLIGYINSLLEKKKIGLLDKLKKESVLKSKSIDTAAGEAGAVTGAELISTEDADAGIKLQERAAREAKEVKKPIKDRLKFGPAKEKIITKLKEKLAQRVKYRISLFDATKSKNKFTTDFVRDLHKDLQEAAYEIVMEGMNPQDIQAFEKFLSDNYVEILEGLTTTYLSRAFPQAIQKKIVGEGWVNYPKWKGAKRGSKKGDVAFWKATEEGPYKGNTSGPQKIRRIKNIRNTIPKQEFINKYIKGDEFVERSTEALARQLAAEMSLDILVEEIRNDGPIAQSLFERQELIRGMASTMAANDVIAQIERPGIKFSKVGITGTNKLDNARTEFNKYFFSKSQAYRERLLEKPDIDPEFVKLYEALKSAHENYLKRIDKNNLSDIQKVKAEKFLRYEFDTFDKYIEAQIRFNDNKFIEVINDLFKGIKGFTKITSKNIGYNISDAAKTKNYINDLNNIAIPYADSLIEKAKTREEKIKIINDFIEFFGGSYTQKAFKNNAEFKNKFINPLAKKHGINPNLWTLKAVSNGNTILFKGQKVSTIYKQEAGAADIAPVIESTDKEITNTISIKERNKNAKRLAKIYINFADYVKKGYENGEITTQELGRISNALHSGYMRAGGKALAQLNGIVLLEGIYDSQNYTYEHTPPSNLLKRAFFLYTTNRSNVDLKKMVDNSFVVVMPTAMSNIVDEIYQSSMGKNYRLGDDFQSILENRYFEPTVQKIMRKEGLDLSPNTIQDPNSKYLVRSPRLLQSKATIRYSLDTRLDDNGKPVYFYPDYADNEDLDSPVVEWSSDLFKVGPLEPNQYYSIDMGVIRGKKGSQGVDVMFRLIETKSGSPNLGADSKLNITNQFKDNLKTPLKVFSIVGNALLDFIKENPNYNFISFSGTDASRVRLYDRLGRMLAQELGWQFKVTREVYTERRDGIAFDKEVSEYLVTKPASIKQSKAAKQKQKLINNNNNLLPANQRLDAKNVSNQDVLRKMKGLDKKEAEIRFSKINPDMLDKQFNVMIEQTTGIKSESEYSEARAKMDGRLSGKKWWFIPPTAQDFMGLMYAFVGKGKVGDAQLKWIQRNLVSPYARAAQEITRARRAMYRDYDALKKELKIVPKDLKEKIPGSSFTVQHAVRAYIFTQEGHEIPGLTEKEARELKKYVADRPDLVEFAEKIRSLLKGTQMAKPRKNWTGGTITTDLLETLNTTKRAEALAEWQANVDAIFSKKNLNKIEALYGSNFRYALENSLMRMKTGRNRNYGPDSQVGKWMDWLNSQTGTIMFFNMRSAVLQTISTLNFMNWSDNNPLEAAKAFANQKQYWADFFMLFNSDFLVDRRDGLKMEVNESDIADMAKEGASFQTIVNKVLKAGFVPTQIADSFAIAAGGATFYRNRLNRYIKEGMEPDKAAEQAFMDFRETAEEAQQSSRPDKISAQQAGNLGRFILAFANTPAQYARLMNKAYLDLKNGRGDAKTNISKIIYYGAAQNLLFNALQQALFAFAFDEDEEEEKEKNEKYLSIANGMFDSVLRGIGVHGAIISTLKNTAIELYKESGKDPYKQEFGKKAVIGLSGIAPPLNSKIRKLYRAGDIYKYNNKEIKQMGWDIDNPALLAGANVISSVSNLPTDRMVQKSININDALTEDITTMQRIALFAGWSGWNLKIPKYDRKSQSGSSRGKGFNRKRRGFKPRKF